MWLTDPCRYDRWTRPLPLNSNGKSGGPTRVSARVYVYFLGSVEAQQLVGILIFFTYYYFYYLIDTNFLGLSLICIFTFLICLPLMINKYII